jgi:hypothetical protein
MSGEKDLAALLCGMAPVLEKDAYGFAVVPALADVPRSLRFFALMNETEGTTIVALTSDLSEAGLPPGPGFARITLTIHSSLEAVGLTAALSTALANAGISANVVAAYHHDHIFVAWSDRKRAMSVLATLAAG